MKKYLLALLFTSPMAFAVDVTVRWTLPTTKVDGTPIPTLATDPDALKQTVLQWGSCNADGSFGTQTGTKNVAMPGTSTVIAMGNGNTCVRARVDTNKPESSAWSNVKRFTINPPNAPVIE